MNKRRGMGQCGTAIAWGPWGGGGMTEEQFGNRLTSVGLRERNIFGMWQLPAKFLFRFAIGQANLN
jgi:hypothetical protein